MFFSNVVPDLFYICCYLFSSLVDCCSVYLSLTSGEGSSDVIDVLALQCAHVLQMSGKVQSLKDGEKMVRNWLQFSISVRIGRNFWPK